MFLSIDQLILITKLLKIRKKYELKSINIKINTNYSKQVINNISCRRCELNSFSFNEI
jgi:hypothetical protein